MGHAKTSESVYEELDRIVNAPIRAEDFSFDYQGFGRHMESNDAVSLVLKAHLYVEHILIRHIEMSLGKANDIEIDRMSFPLKVALARRFMLKEVFIDACLYLNALRNRVAHRVDFDIGEAEVQGFLDSMGQHFCDLVLDMASRLEGEDLNKLRKYMYILKASLRVLIEALERMRIERERHEKVLLRRLEEFSDGKELRRIDKKDLSM